MPVELNIESLKSSAEDLASDMSFHEFAEMVTRMLISGQTLDDVKAYLTENKVKEIFDNA